MRQVKPEHAPAEGKLLLLTMESAVSDGAPVMAADLKDTMALFHSEIGRFVGLDLDGVIRFGLSPEMSGGIWYVSEDVPLRETARDVEVSSKNLVLRVIE